ncbi:MAG: Bacterial dynamin-like protein [uncultured Sulfurovum sp.]|uniref:Bacterial dynamin-like protein n=1 Tax=uncultured Sulfurovum sp. TaxID=269237 RepID=A0A6S6SVM4_9BACT|nr:MAG: Bacterial dynamin-like protein [uncultured Sulfurovum sp.]
MNKEIMTIDNLENKIENLLGYFSEYPNETNKQNLNKIQKDLNNQEYKIAVVANMSSGKSTFINALFGITVLPAFNHATTDSATFIHSEADIEKRAIIYFNDEKKPVEIKDELEREIKQYAQKDEECKDKKYKNVEKIELYYPFKNLQTSSNKDFKITFIDTPGPNSTGESYKQKHQDQTRSVLNDVDLALFMFDYTQLDANLSSDEQGLWDTIKKRHDKDKNFDVYFILNKIDIAFDDNLASIEGEAKDEHECIELMKKEWYVHEEKAIEKLKKAAKVHRINKPKIYPVSSKNQLLKREGPGFGQGKRDFNSFKKVFSEIFPDQWETEFIKYLGIEKLEKDINTYIDNSVKAKILTKINSQLSSIHADEKKGLELRRQTLQKPQQEAEENLIRAKNFLKNRAKEMQEEMKVELSKLEAKYISVMETIVDNAIENELISKIDEMAKRTIHFSQSYAYGEDILNATDDAKRIPLSKMKINLESDKVKIKIDEAVDIRNVSKQMQNFMKNIFEDYKRNYLDVKTDIKEEYFNFERESNELFLTYKKELENQLENALDVKVKILETESIDYNSMLNMDIKVPDSVLDYDFKSAKYETISTSSWWNPFSWGDTEEVEVSSEKYEFIIAPKKMKTSIKTSMKDSVLKFLDNEKNVHKDSIKTYLMNNTDIFQKFRHIKQKEIDSLVEDITSMEKNLISVQSKYSNFIKMTKGK